MNKFILAAAVLLAALAAAAASGVQTCTVQGPSLVTPFQGGDPYRLAMPCRYQLTDFYVPFEDHKCRPRIFAHGFKIGGKFYVNGFDVRLSLYIGDDEYDYVAVKAFSKWNSDFTSSTKLLVRQTHFDAGDKWTAGNDISRLDTIFPNSNNFFDVNADGSVTFSASACGVNITFTPVNYDLSNVIDAGITLDIPAEGPVFQEPLQSACFANCMSPEDLALVLGASSSLDAMTYSVATHWRLNQAHTYADRGQCRDMQTITTNCEKANLPNAIRNCMFVLTDSSFAACLSPPSDINSENVIVAFNQCMNAFCSGSGICSDISLGSCSLPANHPCSI